MHRAADMQWDYSAWLGHTFSTAAVVSAVLGILPTVGTILATFAAFVWYAVQVYESKTVQKYLMKRRKRKVATLQRHIEELEDELHKIIPGKRDT